MKSRSFTIQQLNSDDGERLRELRLRSLEDAPEAFGTTLEEAVAWSAEDWSRQVAQFATFVASTLVSDVGLVRGALNPHLRDTGYLISMWVAPEARRQGVGSALIDAVVRWAISRQLNRLLLHVGEENTAAIALYARKGFVPNGQVSIRPPPKDHIREIEMVLTLREPRGDDDDS